ncbi:MAG TPA: GtrA family protein [Candidatus Eisenbacteria bacterium]|nr:GtrA family protein [Candidatus Eisenbacteria bacterium]
MIDEARLLLHRDAPLGRHARRFVRFGMVGGSGVVVNNALLLGLVELLRLPAVPAAAVATECAIVSNFLLNDRWTFADVSRAGGRSWLRRFASYNLLTLGGLVLGVGVLALLHGVAGVHYLLANLAGIGIGTLWNYGSNHHWTWARRRAS